MVRRSQLCRILQVNEGMSVTYSFSLVNHCVVTHALVMPANSSCMSHIYQVIRPAQGRRSAIQTEVQLSNLSHPHCNCTLKKNSKSVVKNGTGIKAESLLFLDLPRGNTVICMIFFSFSKVHTVQFLWNFCSFSTVCFHSIEFAHLQTTVWKLSLRQTHSPWVTLPSTADLLSFLRSVSSLTPTIYFLLSLKPWLWHIKEEKLFKSGAKPHQSG